MKERVARDCRRKRGRRRSRASCRLSGGSRAFPEIRVKRRAAPFFGPGPNDVRFPGELRAAGRQSPAVAPPRKKIMRSRRARFFRHGSDRAKGDGYWASDGQRVANRLLTVRSQGRSAFSFTGAASFLNVSPLEYLKRELSVLINAWSISTTRIMPFSKLPLQPLDDVTVVF